MKVIIIDDEALCCKVIEHVLTKHCPQVQMLASCHDGIEGLKAISKFQPDVVFLDIEMPRMNGFQMLEALGTKDLPFSLVFTTAYDQFAIKAFKFSAFDYLLKPIDNDQQNDQAFKANARKHIALQGFDIILNVGDQESDLKGGYAEVKVKLPNPFYERA